MDEYGTGCISTEEECVRPESNATQDKRLLFVGQYGVDAIYMTTRLLILGKRSQSDPNRCRRARRGLATGQDLYICIKISNPKTDLGLKP